MSVRVTRKHSTSEYRNTGSVSDIAILSGKCYYVVGHGGHKAAIVVRVLQLNTKPASTSDGVSIDDIVSDRCPETVESNGIVTNTYVDDVVAYIYT